MTAAQREAELAKLEFVFIYNNERLNLQSRSRDLLVEESIVKTFKINPKTGPIQVTSEVTQMRIERMEGLIFPNNQDAFQMEVGAVGPSLDPA